MCGIVGYIGPRDAYPILIKGLKRLEYRGYDSAGIALLNEDLNVYKCSGKVADLEAFIHDKDIAGTIGMAHTRWATHGEPNDANAHPHFSQSENLAIIHNGIIENYQTLREELINRGHQFSSDTDTEVLIQLVEDILENENVELEEAIRIALNQVVGYSRK
jgi:glucosamine--fructose-6-phosphate aminotransferase (isomerizing)